MKKTLYILSMFLVLAGCSVFSEGSEKVPYGSVLASTPEEALGLVTYFVELTPENVGSGFVLVEADRPKVKKLSVLGAEYAVYANDPVYVDIYGVYLYGRQVGGQEPPLFFVKVAPSVSGDEGDSSGLSGLTDILKDVGSPETGFMGMLNEALADEGGVVPTYTVWNYPIPLLSFVLLFGAFVLIYGFIRGRLVTKLDIQNTTVEVKEPISSDGFQLNQVAVILRWRESNQPDLAAAFAAQGRRKVEENIISGLTGWINMTVNSSTITSIGPALTRGCKQVNDTGQLPGMKPPFAELGIEVVGMNLAGHGIDFKSTQEAMLEAEVRAVIEGQAEGNGLAAMAAASGATIEQIVRMKTYQGAQPLVLEIDKRTIKDALED